MIVSAEKNETMPLRILRIMDLFRYKTMNNDLM